MHSLPSYSLVRTKEGKNLMDILKDNFPITAWQASRQRYTGLTGRFFNFYFITPTWDMLEGSAAERLSICTGTNLGRGSGEKDSYGVNTHSGIFKSCFSLLGNVCGVAFKRGQVWSVEAYFPKQSSSHESIKRSKSCPQEVLNSFFYPVPLQIVGPRKVRSTLTTFCA